MNRPSCKPTVLVVDDRSENLRAMKRLLASSFVEIETADSGEKAFSIALRHNLAMILLDVRMPGMDGYETAEMLHINKSTRDIPIIFVTAESEDEVKSYEAGGVDFLRKPIEPMILRSKVKVFAQLWIQKEALRRTNEELAAAREEAELAVKVKADFLATMSHEIRTPLNGILGMTGLLMDSEMDDVQRDHLDAIRFSGDHLLAVINDILDYSKIEAGQLELEIHPFDLRGCLDEVLALTTFLVGAKPLELSVNMDNDVPAFIKGDDTRLRQILVNLLSNAIKFTDEGEICVRVNKVEETLLRFSVTDTGIGIPQNKLKTLFEAFSQADVSTTRRYGGTGLGLTICARLIEKMDGRIWIESEEGVGSTFFFTLRTQATEAYSRGYDQSDMPKLHGKRGLIVDHNLTTLQMLTLQLQRWGVQAKPCNSPKKALRQLKKDCPYDVIFIKNGLPGDGGHILAKSIREIFTKEDLPMVLLENAVTSPSEHELDQGLFSGSVSQPIKLSELYDTFVSALTNEKPSESLQSIEDSIERELCKARKLRILLAEDNAINQKLALRVLEKMGYHADVAHDGRQAFEALKRRTYDLIFMDVQMPDMDGLEATRLIVKEWPPEKRPKIIAMTANTMTGDRERCLAVGMDDYIGKPIHFHEVKAAIKRWGPKD